MRHKIFRMLSVFLAGSLLFFAAPTVTLAPTSAAAPVEPVSEFRGIWVATVLNLDYPSKKGLSVDALKKEADSMLDNAAGLGYNAVVLQVRPASDAFYKSSYFPWSGYLSSSQGTAPTGGFDPLKYWVEQAHARGLQLHAWINPFRVTQGSASSPQHNVNALAANHPARLNPSWTVAHSDGKLYFNPGLPEVRKLIINGVSEIVKNYDVDGIQFDDYFYPGTDFKDDAAYTKYGSGYSSKADWRRDNVNALIRDTYNAVKTLKKDVVFGVAPFGIWANKSSSQYGSDTRGNESYYNQYADTRKWVKSGWLDYIAPQLYWHIGFSVADYAKLVPWWADVVKGTPVKLYIGQAIYRAGEGKSAGDPWYGTDEISRQAALNKNYSQVSGVIHFRYDFLTTNEALRNTVSKTFGSQVVPIKPTPPSIPENPETGNTAEYIEMPVPNTSVLGVGRPTGTGVTTGASSYYILGTSNPSQPLYMNGQAVETRSSDGFFGVLVKLSKGANVFTFSQSGQKSVTTTITYKVTSPAGPTKMSKAEISAGSAFPKTANEYRQPGETVTLSCTAPIGATVTVSIGGSSYTMTPNTKTAPSDGGIYATVYTYSYKFPASSSTGKLVTIGTPKYSMTYKGTTASRNAGGALISITDRAPFYATIKSETAFVYPGGTTSGGPKNELVKGQKDYITAVSSNGEWVRLRGGGWIQASDATLSNEKSALGANLSSVAYSLSDKSIDMLLMSVSTPTYTGVSFDGKILTLELSGVTKAPSVSLPTGSLFASATASYSDGKATYRFTLPQDGRLDGYYITYKSGSLVLNLKRHPKAVSGSKPLTGITILLDPGHGGSDTGAIGPMGTALAEKHVNFYTAIKLKAELESRGAEVHMTRTDDTNPSLNDRVVKSRTLRPDLFLSVHANSVAESTDSTNIRGIETFYRNMVGKPLSDIVRNTVIDELSYGNRSSKEANLYVNRPTWTPSALIETGFMCNVDDFSRLASNSEQTKLAVSIANAIESFFS